MITDAAIAETILIVLGISLNAIGAVMIAKNDLKTDEEIKTLAVTRLVNRGEELELPLAKDMIKQRKWSRRGLVLIIFGSSFLVIAALLSL